MLRAALGQELEGLRGKRPLPMAIVLIGEMVKQFGRTLFVETPDQVAGLGQQSGAATGVAAALLDDRLNDASPLGQSPHQIERLGASLQERPPRGGAGCHRNAGEKVAVLVLRIGLAGDEMETDQRLRRP